MFTIFKIKKLGKCTYGELNIRKLKQLKNISITRLFGYRKYLIDYQIIDDPRYLKPGLKTMIIFSKVKIKNGDTIEARNSFYNFSVVKKKKGE